MNTAILDPRGHHANGAVHEPFMPPANRPPAANPLRQLLAALLNYRKVAVAAVLLGLAAGWVAQRALPPSFRATALLMLQVQGPRVASRDDAIFAPSLAASEPAIIRSEVEILGSESLIDRVIDQLHLADTVDAPSLPRRLLRALGLGGAGTRTPLRPDQLETWYRRHLTVRNDDKTLAITVSFTADSPELATRIAATHAELYLADQRNRKGQAVDRAASWLTGRIEALSASIDAEEAAIVTFRQLHGLAATGDATLASQRLTDLNKQLAAATAVRSGQEARLGQIKAALARRTWMDGETDLLDSPIVRQLDEQRASLQRNIDALRQAPGVDPALVSRSQAQLDDLARAMRTEAERVQAGVQDQLELARSREGQLNEGVSQLKARVNDEERASLKLADMSRQVETDKTVYGSLLLRRSQIEADPARHESDAWLVSPAKAPLQPVSVSGSLLVLAGGVAGLFAVVCWLAAREVLSGRIRDVDDLSAKVGLRTLGIFPRIAGRDGREDYARSLPGTVQSHEVDRIRHGLAAVLGGRTGRTVLVTSALPGEGKSMLALALARSFAANGERTLLVEMDLYRPVLKQTLALGGEAGTVAALTGQRPLADCLQADPAGPLRIMAAEAPAEARTGIMTSAGIDALMEQAAGLFDVIVLDTAPLAAIPDSLALCRHASVALLAVRCDATPVSLVRTAGDHLLASGIGTVGTVLVGYDLSRQRYAPSQYASYHRALRDYYQA